MAKLDYLHSHSGIESENKFHKNQVLIDKEFEYMFDTKDMKSYSYNGKEYVIVPILKFVAAGGVFKRFNE